jgi:hypothetical protein
MSIDTALNRVATINQVLSNPAALIGASAAVSGGTSAPASGASTTGGESSFAAALQSASANYATAAAAGTTGTEASAVPASTLGYGPAASSTPGLLMAAQTVPSGTQPVGASGIVAAAESQIGQAEQPPGSNESPAIAEYRSATAGAMPGAPWCAYFASWASRQAGEPLGPQGQGLGSVSEIWSWAQSAGRAVPNGPGVTPKPGDLIVFGGEHVGIVKGVLPDGQIQTIEGNYNNQVSANVRSATEATGYVSMS